MKITGSETVLSVFIKTVNVSGKLVGRDGKLSANIPAYWKAANTYSRKRAGSLSPSSIVSQAIGEEHPFAHSLSRVVFPYPAGADTRVSFWVKQVFKCATRRAREICSARREGM